jgi:phage protein D
VTALLRPAYVLTFRDPGGGIGKVVRSTSTPGTSTVTGLRAELGADGAADRVTLDMGQVGSFRPAVGQQVTVELGFTEGADPQQVTVATVVDADPDLRTRRVVAHGAADALLHTRVDRTFENATAGSIVTELAQAAGVDVAQADDGITFPAYVIDARRSAYHHIGELAALCGFDRYVANDGRLVFAFFTGGRTSHVFEHGKHILQVRMDRRPAFATQVTVIGESPGAAKGDDSWAWFARDLDPFTGKAGSGERTLLLERSALRTSTATAQTAQAVLTELARRASAGELLVTGAPEVRLGDALRLSGVPEPGVDGTYQVRSVVHEIGKDSGFTTRVGFRSIETPGATR